VSCWTLVPSLSDGLKVAASTKRLPLHTVHLNPPSPLQARQSNLCSPLPSILIWPPPWQGMHGKKPAPMQPGQSTLSSGSGSMPRPPHARQGAFFFSWHSMHFLLSSRRAQCGHSTSFAPLQLGHFSSFFHGTHCARPCASS